MSVTRRFDLYKTALVNNNKELDYLDTKIYEANRVNGYTYYTVVQSTEHRLDLISYIHYNTVDLWWLIAQYNEILDPLEEVVMGRVLQIPALPDYYKFYNNNSKIDEIEEVFSDHDLEV
jgi:hypothetical protein